MVDDPPRFGEVADGGGEDVPEVGCDLCCAVVEREGLGVLLRRLPFAAMCPCDALAGQGDVQVLYEGWEVT
jgi:hypothetical protein